MKSIKFSFITLLVLVSTILSAQNEKRDTLKFGSLELLTNYTQDSIVLRWGYTKADLWYLMLNDTIEIFRREVGPYPGKYEKIGEASTWSEMRMESTAASLSNPDMLVVVLEQCHRNWENTKFAGSPGDLFERSNNFQNRYSLTHFAADRNPLAADAAGLRFVDYDIAPDVTYAYRIQTKSRAYSKKNRIVQPFESYFKPILFDLVEKDSTVILRWEKHLHDLHFTSYFIERKKENVWVRDNEFPYVMMMDESIDIDQRYYTYKALVDDVSPTEFRIVGITPFGDESAPSTSLAGKYVDRTPPLAPQLFQDTSLTHFSRKLFWTQENPEDVSSYALERTFGNATYVEENWASASQREKTDKLVAEGVYKYRLIAVDSAGNKAYSEEIYARIYDLEPPAVPQGLSARADTSGIIILEWDTAEEKDVIGYYIYTADARNRHFDRITNEIWHATTYIDSVDAHLLTEKKYYYVVAIDNDYLYSGHSDTLEVDRPDLVPPSPAHILDYKVNAKGIEFAFVPSSSRDVQFHLLERKNSDSQEWMAIEKFESVPRAFRDVNVSSGQSYTYRIVAVDEQGLRSKILKEVGLTASGLELVKPELVARLDSNQVHLHFTQVESAEYIELYKSVGGSQMRRIEILSADLEAYSDDVKMTPGQYSYRIRMINKNGKKTPFSEVVKIEL